MGEMGSGFKVGYKSIGDAILLEVGTLKIKGIHLIILCRNSSARCGILIPLGRYLWHGDMGIIIVLPRSGVEQDQLTDLTTYVEGVVLGVTPDRWYWTLDGSGEFSVASARKVIDDNRIPEVSTQTRWIKAVATRLTFMRGRWRYRIVSHY
ncbi:hypothetical protein Tco_0891277 [Tanacetum coccineum]|uniref:Uncharacterized protein n=1 Tax=Tanacetum coccineum TaxID=301880 RepID=A0ABQ5C2G6_9ASTR